MTSLKIPTTYQADVLGPDYQQFVLEFPDDYEGKVVATLVRKKNTQATTKAILYIHGFIDYFFQTEMADQFNQQGFDFYALDLRKYGRSRLGHQQLYNVRDLSEYDAEINKALEIIQAEGHDAVLLSGHSTGGLICTLFAAHHPQHSLIKGLWANSPFYDFNMSEFEKNKALPQLSKLGRLLPNLTIPSGLNKWYVPSLHCHYHGEWNFNLEWKQPSYKMVKLSFVRAIHEAQKEIHAGVTLTIPTLVMHSHQTTNPKKWGIEAQTSDVILNVNDIQKYAEKMIGDISIQTIENGLHDLVLSAPKVREQVYQNLFAWIKEKGI
ncbi:alpha/beta hydrolase [Acinetobacter sp. ACNIH2]|uniref:alpha/beta hydrolase n=1 Tax=unclassified Acinetobacter TaxID=196816 RepID=UPI000CDC9304|nr:MULTISPECIES: alpha/beta hydrolase [unclassified Acinetobacter]AUX87731.1 alpha/beta hydrolase [Acinetobacter sp. ACNIH2]UOG19414.1 alpha/beta hydrolase [Acinetobacter sp. PK01]